MRIGIDARLYSETGVGRYIRNLLRELAVLDNKNEYIIFLRKKEIDSFVPPNARWKKVLADIPWHSFSEQVIMPLVFLKENLDLLHVPYFNAPVFYPKKYILTIHDLTILHFSTGKASTLPYILYMIRRFGYRIVLYFGIKRAVRIMTVSKTVKSDIVKQFNIKGEDITVTYEGVDPELSGTKNGTHAPSQEYFLYVGNAYPHKNLEVILEASKKIQAKIIYVGNEDYFYRRLGIKPTQRTGNELAHLYRHAKALIFPSLMEGFGLPAIEALALGCPVICSDIPVFHEILKSFAVYVKPHDIQGFVYAMQHVSRVKRIPDQSFFDQYSWKNLATKTLAVYEKA